MEMAGRFTRPYRQVELELLGEPCGFRCLLWLPESPAVQPGLEVSAEGRRWLVLAVNPRNRADVEQGMRATATASSEPAPSDAAPQRPLTSRGAWEPRGSWNRVSDRNVADIRAARARGVSVVMLAREYGMCRAAIYKIVKMQTRVGTRG